MTPAEQLRELIRGEIEASTGEGLNVNDSLPDQLITTAEDRQIPTHALIAWMHDRPRHGWSPAELVNWCERWGIIPAHETAGEAAETPKMN